MAGQLYCRVSKVLNTLLICSVLCSVVLLLWSSRLDSSSTRRTERIAAEEHHDSVDSQEATLVRFHTTFHYQDGFKYDTDESNNDQLKLLQQELKYTKERLKNLKEKHNSEHDKKPCKHNEVPKCQVLHIAIVCAGYKETRRVATLVKSILIYRHHPLNFHFISDAAGRHVLSVLFKTWKLQMVNINFYDADKLKNEVEWIPNHHYSGVYGLMKLTLTNALPDFLDKVIVLDTDVFFLTDIAELWKYFDNFTAQQAVGLVENQSEWYTGKIWKKYKHWPALGRGFNTGVMLFDLKKLRAIRWKNLWRLTAEKQLINLLSTNLADQDVINAALKDNPKVVYQLPCEWNIQLSDNAKSKECYEQVSDLKVIHWNSPKKQGVKHAHAEHFRNMYLTYLQYDGNLLRKKIFPCTIGQDGNNTSLFNEKKSSDNECYDIEVEQSLSRRVHLFYLNYDNPNVDKYDVTLLGHLSMDRLQILELLAQQWEGPMSITLYASDAEAQQFLRYAEKSPILIKRKNIGVHVVYKDGDLYPVNYLRNIALEQVHTPYLFLSDIDFLPVKALYQNLRTIVSSTDMNKKAYVIPAFETFQYKVDLPQTKSSLLSFLRSGKFDTFRGSVWPKGHAPTNFEKWKSTSENYRISWQPDFEPYILVKKSGLPFYDMRFIGFGWNKVSHIMELQALRYEFHVVANGFIIHMPHAPSIDISKFRISGQYRRCLQKLKEEFRRDLARKYGTRLR